MLSAGLGIIAVPLAAIISLLVQQALRGRNVSDVGVPMYAHSEIAAAIALFTFCVVLWALLTGVRRIVGGERPWLLYAAAGVTALLLSPLFYLALFW